MGTNSLKASNSVLGVTLLPINLLFSYHGKAFYA